ncbi:InlB B-repeat-containing protein [Faecalibacterium prausnitzii]|uniref:Bacterial repeat domain-containing protein n=1 Tax=Faecalibacterium prausnitzii TaxID=853 RepID=A0A2A7ALY3_9FIRM|nr:hypothetical protein [Faecalibacterium prausnitzii]PDX80106.1 hypothetical protein CGS58_14430 [Faecalibacterium prausnitzii]
MKKRILSLVLVLSMMISLFPVSALAQTPGGGSAVLAEENGEDINAANGADVTTIQIDSNGEPVTSGLHTDSEGYWVGNGWKYMDGADSGLGTLTLMSGTWDFTKQNAVKCDVMILKDAVVSGGMFEGIVWNEADGKISGGTFKKAVSNKGTITGGIFVGVDLENTSVINYDTGKITGGVFENNVTNGDSGDEEISASITGGLFKAEVQNDADSATITGGVFVTKPTGSGTIAKGYTLTTRGTSSKFVYAADGKEIDLDQSVYVIPNDTDALKVVGDGVSNWDVVDGSGTYALTNWDGVTLKQDGSFTLNPDKINGTTLMFTESTTPVTPDPELVLADGVPDTSEGHAKQKTVDGKTVYYGNGWEYDGKTLTLNPTEAKIFDLGQSGGFLKCKLEVGEKATVKGWIFLSRPVENHGVIDGPKFHTEGNGYSGYPTLTNYGTVRNCYVDYGYVTNNGTMENVSFVCCKRLTNNAGATIKNAIIRTDDRNGKMSYSNSGKIDEAVFDFSPSGEQKVHVLKASSGETVGATLSGIKAVVFGTEVYIVGEPEVKVKISGSNKETITDVNGKTTYGGLTVGKDSEGFQKFIVQEKDKELVLNQIGAPDPSEVKHTLTLNDAVIVKDDGSTATTGKYKEGVTVKIKPQINDSKKVFSRWSTDLEGFEAIVPNDDTEGTYTLTMPGYNLSVRAESTYRSYPLTVVGGTFENTFGNRVEWSAHVTVKANVPYGKYFAGWEAKETGTDTAVTLRDWSGKVIDLMDENLTTLRFPMPDKAVTLTAVYKDCEKKLVMKADGTPDLTHVYKENGRRYVGDGWWYFSVEDGSEVNALYLSPDALTEYDFAHTDPIGKTGTLEAVNCIIVEYNANATIVGGTFAEEVDNRGTIWNGIFKGKVYNGDVPYSATIKNGTFMGEVINSNNSTITGGVFAGGVKRSETDVISGGIFNEGTALKGINGAHKIVLEGAQILSINGVSRANGWSNVYAFAETELTVEASQSIYNVNGETTGATGLQTSTIKFTMSDEDAVLNKGVTPDPETKPNPNPTPNPDAQPKTYTVTVKGGKINNETEVKAEKGTKLTVDVDESEVPEGMTFDVWSIRFPERINDTLTGDPSVMLHDPHMSFAMPGADITIEAQYRSSELPGEDDGPSTLGTMATVAVGGAAAGILVWQGVSLGVDSYLQLNLPKGVAVPANRRELVVLLWETAGKPEAALPSLYSDVPAEEIELQKATRWAIDNGLVKPADDSDASRFDPDRYVTKYDVFGAWLKLKKLMK